MADDKKILHLMNSVLRLVLLFQGEIKEFIFEMRLFHTQLTPQTLIKDSKNHLM